MSASTRPPAIVAAPRAPVVLRGYVLRCHLVLVLRDRSRPMTVRDLVQYLESRGVATPGRTSKDISDALRWEVARGRVRRVARGTYQVGHVARQTAWRMRRRVAEVVADCR